MQSERGSPSWPKWRGCQTFTGIPCPGSPIRATASKLLNTAYRLGRLGRSMRSAPSGCCPINRFQALGLGQNCLLMAPGLAKHARRIDLASAASAANRVRCQARFALPRNRAPRAEDTPASISDRIDRPATDAGLLGNGSTRELAFVDQLLDFQHPLQREH